MPSTAYDISLPQELVDAIIDELFDDADALLNCSVVCRSWTEACQHHLFHSLTLGGSSNVVRFGKTGAHIRVCSDEQQYLRFDAFLEQHPRITYHIQELDLRIQTYFKQLTFDSQDIAKALGLVLSKLTSLRKFHSNLGKWATFLLDFRTAISSVLLHQSITEVVLGVSEFSSTSELALLLGRNPNLKHLSVSDSAIEQMSPIVADAFFDNVIYLDYLGVDTRGRIDCLFHPPFPISLSKLRKLRLGLIDRCPETQLLLQQQTKSFSPVQGIANLLAKVSVPLPLEDVEILLAAWSMSRKDVIPKADTLLWDPCRQIDAFLARNNTEGRLRRVRIWFVTLDMGYPLLEAGCAVGNSHWVGEDAILASMDSSHP
ncbi:hypothetical protein H0H92_010708 [Tricholoma furcatifolium]|nr:hypothetical protein H0H92_010708 [Tricholoma furcatifolium]